MRCARRPSGLACVRRFSRVRIGDAALFLRRLARYDRLGGHRIEAIRQRRAVNRAEPELIGELFLTGRTSLHRFFLIGKGDGANSCGGYTRFGPSLPSTATRTADPYYT